MQLTSDAHRNRLEDKVILIINGLSESGGVLAVMLAEQGSDVAIVDFEHKPTLARRICRDIEAIGQRCLVITSDSAVTEKRPFLEVAMHRITDSLGKLDTFISYSASDSETLEDGPATMTDTDEDGRVPKPDVFDQDGLTIAALRHIHAHNPS